jgi:hypothetical protein
MVRNTKEEIRIEGPWIEVKIVIIRTGSFHCNFGPELREAVYWLTENLQPSRPEGR